MDAPEKVTGMSLEWTGRHHSLGGDFEDLSTHTITYVTDETCFATADGKLVGEASYVYQRLDNEIGICIYRPTLYQGRKGVVLQAIFDFHEMTDRAVITADGEPFAVANGRMRSVTPQPKPAS
ncbi:MAG: hypothetical protein ACR2QW_17220 [bacterium]